MNDIHTYSIHLQSRNLNFLRYKVGVKCVPTTDSHIITFWQISMFLYQHGWIVSKKMTIVCHLLKCSIVCTFSPPFPEHWNSFKHVLCGTVKQKMNSTSTHCNATLKMVIALSAASLTLTLLMHDVKCVCAVTIYVTDVTLVRQYFKWTFPLIITYINEQNRQKTNLI